MVNIFEELDIEAERSRKKRELIELSVSKEAAREEVSVFRQKQKEEAKERKILTEVKIGFAKEERREEKKSKASIKKKIRNVRKTLLSTGPNIRLPIKGRGPLAGSPGNVFAKRTKNPFMR